MTDQELEAKKQEFLDIWDTHVKRPGADRLRSYLLADQNDFFTAPASTRYHGAYAGGLLEHSLNVYHNLKAYLERERVHKVYGFPEYTEETIDINGTDASVLVSRYNGKILRVIPNDEVSRNAGLSREELLRKLDQ